MPAIVLQRYLLATQGALNNVINGGEGLIIVNTPTVPLSAPWTVRMRHLEIVGVVNDNSGSLQAQSIYGSWLFFNSAGTQIYSLNFNQESWITPYWAFPKFANALISVASDFDQTVSSLDVVGPSGPISGIAAQGTVVVTNSDATNPHGITVTTRAILEFQAPGSSE